MSSRDRIRRFWTRTWRRFWNELPPWVLLVVGASVLLGGAWLAARPGYARFRAWRMERNFEAALAAERTGDAASARSLSQALILSGDRRIETLRVMERAMATLRDPRHEEIAFALFGHPAAQLGDRARAFGVVVPSAAYGRVRLLWASLDEVSRKDPRFRLPVCDRMLSEGAFQMVIQLLADVPSTPLDPGVTLRRIRAAIGLATPESYELAQQGIVDMWTVDPDSPQEVWALLEQLPIDELDGFLLKPLRPWLARGRSGQPGRAELIGERIRWTMLAPGLERDAVASELIASWKDRAPVPLGRFLAAVGRDEELVQVLDDACVGGDRDRVALRLEALRRLERPDDMALTLLLQGGTLEPMWTRAWQAAACRLAGDTATLADAWRKAIDEGRAGEDGRALIDLQAFAQRVGMDAEWRSAMVAAIRDGRGPLPAYDQLRALLKALEDEGLDADLLDLHKQFVRFEPWNPVVVNRYCHLAALSGLEEPAVLIQRLEGIEPLHPGLGQTTAVLATLHLLAGDAAAAETCWQRLKLPAEDLAPGFRAARLVNEVLAGRLHGEDPAVLGLPWDSLLPCERSAFRRILRATAEASGAAGPEEPDEPEPTPGGASESGQPERRDPSKATEDGDIYLPPLPPVKAH